MKIRENRVELRGMIYSDPIIRVSNAAQKEYAKFTVQTVLKSHTGKDVSYYNSLTVWDKAQVETLKSLKKGAGVEVIGRLVDKKMQTPTGHTRSFIDIYVFEVKPVQGVVEHHNSVELYGRLVAQPEIRKVRDNLSVTKVTLAVNNKKSKANEGKPDFLNLSAFGNVADNSVKIQKGKWTEATAIIKNSNYKNKDGEVIYFTELVAGFVGEKVWEDRPAYSSENNKEEDINWNFDEVPNYDDMPFA